MLDKLNEILKQEANYPVACSIDSEHSWGSLDLVSKIKYLRKKVKPLEAERWLLYCNNSVDFLCGLLSLLSLDKQVIICANPSPSWIKNIASNFDAALTDHHLAIENLIQVDFNNACSQKPEENADIVLNGDEVITFFTSGSTGQAKAVRKTLRCLTNEVTTLERSFGHEVKDCHIVTTVSHLHIYGLLFKLLWPFIMRRVFIENLIEYPEQLIPLNAHLYSPEQQSQFQYALISSPAFLSRIDVELTKTSPRIIFSSGGPLKYIDARKAKSYFGYLPIEVFGSTETGGIGYRQQDSRDTRWQLFKGLSLEIKGSSVFLASPHVTTQEAIKLDDKVTILTNEEFILGGRSDRVVKIEEKRVSLNEIEEFLEGMDDVEKCVALVLDGNRQFIGCAIRLSKSGARLARDRGFSHLVKSWKINMKLRFEAVTVPRKWRQVGEFSYNSQGKLDVVSLTHLFEKNKERI